MEENVTNSSSVDESYLWYYDHKGLFWTLISMSILIGIAGVMGKSMVIYAVIYKRRTSGGFRYLNDAVKSLAITDFCFSLFGTPFSIVYWYWGKH